VNLRYYILSNPMHGFPRALCEGDLISVFVCVVGTVHTSAYENNNGGFAHIPCRYHAALKANSHIPCSSHAVPLPRPCRGLDRSLLERHGNGMVSVNQTRPYCVNQMGKTI
jgi:hypothetical protein